MDERHCVDCEAGGVKTKRPAPYGGPRSPLCATHNRERKKRRSARAHELRVENSFGISAAEYEEIYVAQECRCFICRKARGLAKRLAVDHDHDRCNDHDPKIGCRDCIRALLCGPCNQLLGRCDAEALKRAIIVLTDPPAQRILNP